jgi:hypothetical protein
MLHRKDQKDLESRLNEEGIQVLGFEKIGKHFKVHIQQDNTRCFIFAGSTISDWRAVMNIVSYAKRTMKEAKQGCR